MFILQSPLPQTVSKDTIVFFIVSTFGNGDAPNDAKPFDLGIRNMAEQMAMENQNPCESLRFGVLGLGSSAYPHFCAFGRRLDANLVSLGAKRVMPLGICDEAKYPEKTFQDWLNKVEGIKIAKPQMVSVKKNQRKISQQIFRKISRDKFEFYRSNAKTNFQMFI